MKQAIYKTKKGDSNVVFQGAKKGDFVSEEAAGYTVA